MNATINIVCYKQKTLANGEHPLMIRICKDKKKKYKSLGVSILPKYWDFEKNKPKNNCPNKELIQKIINDEMNKYSELLLMFKISNKDFTVDSLMEKVKAFEPQNNMLYQEQFYAGVLFEFIFL